MKVEVTLSKLLRGTVYVVYEDPNLEPVEANHGDTGLDLKSDIDVVIPAGGFAKIPTGVRIVVNHEDQIPGKFVAWKVMPCDVQVRGRSGLASKGILCHVGTVDVSYRGDISAILFNLSGEDHKVSRGDKVAQLVTPVDYNAEVITQDMLMRHEFDGFVLPEEIDTSTWARGGNGFGSSGS